MSKMMKIFKLAKNKPIPIPRSCPFCGGVPKIARCGDQRDLWYVRCSQCYETPIDWGEAKITPEHAVRIYNKRAGFAEHIIRIYNRAKTKEANNVSDNGHSRE